MNVWPLARSPGEGYCHKILPLGSTINSLELFRSAIMIGPGSADGLEPGARCPGWPFTFASSDAIQAWGENADDFAAVPATPVAAEEPCPVAAVPCGLADLEELLAECSASVPTARRNSARMARARKVFPVPVLLRRTECL